MYRFTEIRYVAKISTVIVTLWKRWNHISTNVLGLSVRTKKGFICDHYSALNVCNVVCSCIHRYACKRHFTDISVIALWIRSSWEPQLRVIQNFHDFLQLLFTKLLPTFTCLRLVNPMYFWRTQFVHNNFIDVSFRGHKQLFSETTSTLFIILSLVLLPKYFISIYK